jgi:hypothetical protein
MESLLGAKIEGRLDSLDNWMRFPASGNEFVPEPLLGDLRRDWAFLVEGPATRYTPTTATPIGELLRPHRTTRQREGKEGTEWPMSPDAVVGPAVLLHHLGKGSVLTFAGSPDAATAGEHPVVEARQLLTRAVRFLHPFPRVRIAAPANVEAVVSDDPASRTLRVHLLGYNAPPQATPPKVRPYVLPALIESPPLYRATIIFSAPIRSARALNGSSVLKTEGRRVEATIEDVHEVVVIDY